MTCHRVFIMYGGRILAADTPENLRLKMAGSRQIIAEIAAPQADLTASLKQMAEIEHFNVSAASDNYFRCALTPRDGQDLRPRIFALAREHGWSLRELTRNRHTLEDIYVHVTRPDEEDES